MIYARKAITAAYSFLVEKKVQRVIGFAEAEKADRDFYKKLTGNQRIQICVELSALDTDRPMERVISIRKLSDLPVARVDGSVREHAAFGLA